MSRENAPRNGPDFAVQSRIASRAVAGIGFATTVAVALLFAREPSKAHLAADSVHTPPAAGTQPPDKIQESVLEEAERFVCWYRYKRPDPSSLKKSNCGTGFIIDNGTSEVPVVTNRHVADNYVLNGERGDIQLEFVAQDGKTVEAKPLEVHFPEKPGPDVAVLIFAADQFEGVDTSGLPLRDDEQFPLRKKEPIFLVGHTVEPLCCGQQNQLVAERTLIKETGLTVLSKGESGPGASGSPLCAMRQDKNGEWIPEVAGVHRAIDDDIGKAVRAGTLMEFLREVGVYK